MQVQFTTSEIEAITKPEAKRGATSENVRGLAALADATAGDLSFLGNAKYKTEVAKTRASVVLLPANFVGEPGPNQLFLLLENPSVALARICARIEQALWPKPAPGVHPSAVVAASAQVHASAHVGPLCVVEEGAIVGPGSVLQASVFMGREARVGDGCYLMPGVVLGAGCALANRVRLQPGVVIGSDGFGYEFINGRHEKIPQIGVVV